MDKIDRSQYLLNLKMNLDGLTQLPEGGGPVYVAYMMLMQMMLAWGEQNGGGTMKDQKLLYRIRTALEQATKTQDTAIVLGKDEFEFLNKCRNEAKLDFKANEAIMRLDALIDDAIAEHESRNK